MPITWQRMRRDWVFYSADPRYTKRSQPTPSLMKPAHIFTVLSMTGALLTGAALPLPAKAQEAPRAVFVTPATPAEKEIQSAGDYAIDRRMLTMMNEVKMALDSGTPQEAVDMCHLTGLATSGAIPGLPRVNAVKFTSLKIRTASNTPDPADKLALDYFGQVPVAGAAQSHSLVQRIDTPNGDPEWRVYKPVAVTSKCLICHGNPADQSPALRGKLKAIFPEDQALGYKIGEWRGVIRVTVGETPTSLP